MPCDWTQIFVEASGRWSSGWSMTVPSSGESRTTCTPALTAACSAGRRFGSAVLNRNVLNVVSWSPIWIFDGVFPSASRAVGFRPYGCLLAAMTLPSVTTAGVACKSGPGMPAAVAFTVALLGWRPTSVAAVETASEYEPSCTMCFGDRMSDGSSPSPANRSNDSCSDSSDPDRRRARRASRSVSHAGT